MKCAIVTPYLKESRDLLERCIESVAAQTVPVTHILVADGHPQGWIGRTGVRHLILDCPHQDEGNTPRGMGAVMAAGEEVDAVAFLDADNWLDRDHVETCCDTALEEKELGFVIARRRFVRDDGSALPLDDLQIDAVQVDTSCFFVLRQGFPALGRWTLIPKPLAAIGNQIFLLALRTLSYSGVATDHTTVNYRCRRESYFRRAGELPPRSARPDIDLDAIRAWWRTRDERERATISRLVGGPIRLVSDSHDDPDA